ncbi:kinase-like domain-containing protein [Lentinula raphanica]|nr:kinase-like domain-containing protein [Lentinula raphanica]
MSTALRLLFKDDSDSFLRDYNQSLSQSESFWRDHYDWLKSKGYLLRPRYHPNWVASWIGITDIPYVFEDFQTAPLVPFNLDAIRIADGKPVMLRLADPPSVSDELEIGRLVSSKSSHSDPRNHCVPIYDTLEIPEATGTGRKHIVVMPYLVAWDKVEFQTVGEVVDFCSQVFEGLQFMHNQNIAHNDAKNDNIMMDWSPLYPQPPHFHSLWKRMDWKGPSKPRNRTLYPGRYYFIDWDLSKQYSTATRITRAPRLLPGYGGDQTVPEFKRNQACNPFAVDVYCLGNVIRNKFIEVHSIQLLIINPPRRNVKFLRDLIADMTHDDPLKRPTMDEVVGRFEEIRKRLSWWKLRSRVSDKTFPLIFHRLYSPIHWIIQLSYILRWKPAIPKHTPPDHFNS